MTQSLEDYLKHIYFIVHEKKVARVKDISEALGVKKPSVINAVKELQERGLINHEKYGYVELTKNGVTEAQKIIKKLDLLKNFLITVLGVSEENAERDGCEMEHVLSRETLEKMRKYLESQ